MQRTVTNYRHDQAEAIGNLRRIIGEATRFVEENCIAKIEQIEEANANIAELEAWAKHREMRERLRMNKIDARRKHFSCFATCTTAI